MDFRALLGLPLCEVAGVGFRDAQLRRPGVPHGLRYRLSGLTVPANPAHPFVILTGKHFMASIIQDYAEAVSASAAALAPGDRRVKCRPHLGRLVRVFLPGTISQRPWNPNARPLLSQSVDILDLSCRSANCLQNAGITTIGELTQWSTEKLLELKNMGRKSAGEIKAKLEELLLQNPDESQSQISVRPESFCLSALLSFEQCGIDVDIGRKMTALKPRATRTLACASICKCARVYTSPVGPLGPSPLTRPRDRGNAT